MSYRIIFWNRNNLLEYLLDSRVELKRIFSSFRISLRLGVDFQPSRLIVSFFFNKLRLQVCSVRFVQDWSHQTSESPAITSCDGCWGSWSADFPDVSHTLDVFVKHFNCFFVVILFHYLLNCGNGLRGFTRLGSLCFARRTQLYLKVVERV